MSSKLQPLPPFSLPQRPVLGVSKICVFLGLMLLFGFCPLVVAHLGMRIDSHLQLLPSLSFTFCLALFGATLAQSLLVLWPLRLQTPFATFGLRPHLGLVQFVVRFWPWFSFPLRACSQLLCRPKCQ